MSQDSVEIIGEYAFYGCKGYFDNIVFPKTLREIEYHAFENSSFPELILPDGVTHIETEAFVDTHFDRITFPKTLESLDGDLFYKVSAMPEISYTGSKAEWQDLFFSYLIDIQDISFKKRNCHTGNLE